MLNLFVLILFITIAVITSMLIISVNPLKYKTIIKKKLLILRLLFKEQIINYFKTITYLKINIKLKSFKTFNINKISSTKLETMIITMNNIVFCPCKIKEN